jgi:hypothetical protein
MLKLPRLSTHHKYANLHLFDAMEQLNKYKKKEAIEHFQGNVIIVNLFSLYLRNKYKIQCMDTILPYYLTQLIVTIYDKPSTTNDVQENINKNMHIIDTLCHCIQKGEKLIILLIVLKLYTKSENTLLVSHQNVWIYRGELQQIEHFEPHGYKMMYEYNTITFQNNINKMMEVLVNVINTKLYKNIKYIPPNIVCPNFGFQYFETISRLNKTSKESPGYCSLWSLYFMELVLKNPDMESTQIVNAFYQKMQTMKGTEKNDFFRKLARAYSNVINEKIHKYFKGSNKVIYNMTTEEIIDYFQVIYTSGYAAEFHEQIKEHLDKHIFEEITPTHSPLTTYKRKTLNKMAPLPSAIIVPFHEHVKKCPPGKTLNLKTYRCNKIKTLKKCPPGKIRNMKTKRCNKIK